MLFLIHGILILFFLIGIIYTCLLFTNAIEILGAKLKLGNSATGSILAVIGTTLPETIVPIVAILGSIILKKPTGSDIAQGAIIGSPFMLSCLAVSLIGVGLLFFKKKELNVDKNEVLRFYKYFLITYSVGILATFVHNYSIRILICAFLVFCYIIFIKRTIQKSKETFSEQETEELIFNKFLKSNKTAYFLIIFQILVSLLGLIVSTHFFVKEIISISQLLNFSPLLLSLIITPFATELPECINSLIWTKDKKDTLAIANVLGAVVFQSVIPMSIGILFTPWILDKTILLNSFLVILCSIFVSLAIIFTKRILAITLSVCILFYIGYIAFILL